MTRRRHICDVAGCSNMRKRWQRLCDACFRQLAGHRDITYGIRDAHRTGNAALKRHFARRAGETLGLIPRSDQPSSPPPAPARPQYYWQDRD